MARNKSVVIIISFVAIILLQVSSIVSLTTWPLPSSISQGTGRISIDPDTFQITTSSSSKILQLGIDRYLTKGLIFPFSDTVTPTQTTLLSLSVTVNSDNESLQLGVDESYSLTINSGSTTATLQANTVYGALRGLETFSQLVDYSDADNNYAINCVLTIISDSPRFSWRFFCSIILMMINYYFLFTLSLSFYFNILNYFNMIVLLLIYLLFINDYHL